MEIEFTAELWEWEGKGAWCFVTLPVEYTDEIKMVSLGPKRGFGSVRVEVTIGKTAWKTSIFPDTKSMSYVLPIKKSVRQAEELEVGKNFFVELRLIEA